MISSGVSVPYSDEYRELRSNPATLENISSSTNGQVSTWQVFPRWASWTCSGRSIRSTTSDGIPR